MVPVRYDDIAKAMEVFSRDLGKVRTGRANASMLDSVRLDYYGTSTPLNQVASVSVAASSAQPSSASSWKGRCVTHGCGSAVA